MSSRLHTLVRLSVVAVTMLVFVMQTASAQEQVLGLRIGVHADKTRVVLDLSGKIPYSLFTLPDPYRVVLDLPAVQWTAGSRSSGTGTGLVSGYRFGLFQHDNSRVVLDLARPMGVKKMFFLPPGNGRPTRLVIDLAETDRAAFLATAGMHRKKEKIGKEKVEAVRPAGLTLPPRGAISPLPKPVVRRKITIVLDAGHGGIDPGATSRSGQYEKHIVLDVTKRLDKLLRQSGRYNVVMTRKTDVFVPLRKRVAIGRDAGADLFVSVHADSLHVPKVRGASVYSLSETASDKEAAALAAKENNSDIIAGVNIDVETDDVVKSILIDLAQRETKNKSVRFAKLLLPELGQVGALLRNSHRYAGFRVLTAPDVPSVLVELGLLSNPADDKLMSSPQGRQRLASAIKRAIDAYFGDRDT